MGRGLCVVGSWVVGRAWWFVSRESLASPAFYVLSPHVIFFRQTNVELSIMKRKRNVILLVSQC